MSNTRHSALLNWSPLHPPLLRARAAQVEDRLTVVELEQQHSGRSVDLRGDEVRLGSEGVSLTA